VANHEAGNPAPRPVVIPLFMGVWGIEAQGTLLSVSLYTSEREVSRCSNLSYQEREVRVPHSVAYSTRVPAVYLAHAILAIVATLAVHGMNKLRVPNGPHGSIPTAPTKSL
jgi:hypothetical protein